jgi:alkylation response protein AidB-like acyl-CoA dehydrogenase
VAKGETTFSYGLSEREAGSDVASMRTRAKRDGDDWVLNGTKAWITNSGVSEYYTVYAVTDPEGRRGANITAFVLEKSDEGFTFGEPERKLGIKGSPTRELHFDNVRIPGDRGVGEVGGGMKLALRVLDHTRVTIGAQALGIAQGAFEQAVAYVKDRKQFGQSVSQFQGVQFMLADMAMQIQAARQMVYAAAAKSERGDADLTFFGAAAKCFASDVAMKVTVDAVQLLGGAGYTKDFPVERMMRDAKITQIYEGTNEIQRVVMSRHILK